MIVDAVLGTVADYPGRAVDPVRLTAADAARPRVRRRSKGGRDLALRLPRGTFLRHGDVLALDGDLVVAVERVREPALVIRLDGGLRDGLALGYLLGNQHSPVDLAGDEVRLPLVTGAQTALESIARLGLQAEIRDVRLAEQGWWRGSGAAHRHG